MGNMISNAGSINKMIDDKIQLGNKAYYINSRLPPGIRLLSHMAKMKIYKSLIRPVIAYRGETWTLARK